MAYEKHQNWGAADPIHQQGKHSHPRCGSSSATHASSAGTKRKAALLCSSKETQPETHCIGSTARLLAHTGCINLGKFLQKKSDVSAIFRE
eukprot:s1533_g16.t1